MSVDRVRVDRMTNADAQFTVVLNLVNPNEQAIAVDAIDAELRIEDIAIGTAHLAEPVRLPGHRSNDGIATRARRMGGDIARRRRNRTPCRNPQWRGANGTLRGVRHRNPRRRAHAALLACRRVRVAPERPVAAMTLKFTKMQGLGNDFVVVDGVRQRVDLAPEQIRALADRRFGVGCDQVLVVERAQGDADFRYRIFNADGFEVEQCGNGARCFVVFVRDHGLTDKREIRVETAGGLIVPRLEPDGQVTVDMGVPRFRPEDIPFIGGEGAIEESLDVAGTSVRISALSMGNPHAVQIVSDVEGPRSRRRGR